MAGPFRYFRKHQKAFLAVAGVIAIFVFVIGDSLFSIIRQSDGTNPASEVTSWKGGKLSYHELEMLTQRRFFVSNFLRNMQSLGARRIVEEGGTPVAPGVPNFIIEGTPPDVVRSNVVMTRVLADQGRKAGITISDGLVNHYLKEIGFKRVSGSEILSILQGLRQGDPRALEEQLFAGLRELLLGNAYVSTFGASIGVQLPEERWQAWRRVNERIAVEAATLPVDSFVAEVPEPTDAQLSAFYEEYKDRVGGMIHLVMGTQLPAPDPGFKQPRRVKLNYIVGEVNAWTEKMRDSVTEEEIADYYERNKRTEFVKTGSSVEFDESLFEKAIEESSEDEGEAQPSTEPKEETSEAPATETPAAEAPATEAPAAEQPAAEEPATEQPAADESGSRNRQSPFRLVAAEGESTGETADEAVEPPKEETAAAAEDAEQDAEETDQPAAEEKKEEYESLDSVRDSIRQKLARDKAVQEIKQVMDRVYAELQTEYKPYGFAVVTARTEETEIPAPPMTLTNLKERATKEGLISEETVLLTLRELAETFVGKAVDLQTQQQWVARAAFDSLQLYEPYQALDLDGNRYLVTKAEDEPEVVPALKDIRSEVIAAWKRQEAAKLALKKAEEMSAECEKTGDTLADYCVGKSYEVTMTDLFSAMSFGSTPMELQAGPRLGDAPPLAAVGPDFMKKAFALGEKDVDAVLSYDHANAYVFRLDRRERTQEELRTLFLEEANTWYGGQIIAAYDSQAQQQAVIGQIAKRVGLDMEKLEEALNPKQEQE